MDLDKFRKYLEIRIIFFLNFGGEVIFRFFRYLCVI